jgi:hypothetical protein
VSLIRLTQYSEVIAHYIPTASIRANVAELPTRRLSSDGAHNV